MNGPAMECGAQALGDAAYRRTLIVPWRIPRMASPAIVPVFLPFRGCPVRCVFCAQYVQTGRGESALGIARALADARAMLAQRAARGLPPAELAFYGGTFTALAPEDLACCLQLVAEARRMGWITAFRCSTRPDCVDATGLAALREAGLATVELGVQSFADHALVASRRGYDRATALQACELVRACGLRLGIQLLPGMPGHTPADLEADMAQALEVGADMLRLYPCLVLEGTGLAVLWRDGKYRPWSLDKTLAALAKAWLMARDAGVPVIRMGLAPEESLSRALLDGPQDPALGSRVMGRGLLFAVRRALQQQEQQSYGFDLELPRAAQGYVWGTRRELYAAWTALGLARIFWGSEPVVRLFMR